MANTASIQAAINGMYITLYGRAADSAGYAFWVGSLGVTPAQAAATVCTDAQYQTLAAAFIGTQSAYFDAQYGLTASSGAMLSNAAFVEKLYNNLGNAAGDTAGLLYWTAKLAAGESRTQMAGEFVDAFLNINLSNQAATGLSDADYAVAVSRQQAFDNKIFVSQDYAAQTASNLIPMAVGDAAFVASQNAISGVTSDNSTRDLAIVRIDAAGAANNPALIVSSGSAGQTFTLTTGADTIPTLIGSLGTSDTSGNDTINGTVNYAAGTATPSAASTFNTTDIINGGLGNNTLNLTVTGAATGPNAAVTLPAVAVADIQTLNVTAVTGSGQTITVAAGNFPGVTAINADITTDAIAVTGLASGTSLGMTGNGSVTNGNLAGTYVAGVTAAVLNVTGGTTAGAVAITGNADGLLKTLTINSTGAANTLAGIATPAAVNAVNITAATNLVTGGITGEAAGTTITVSGLAANVDLGTLAANATTVAAAGLTAGGITATLGAVTDHVTGGAGVNTITTGGEVLTTGSVAAGAGTSDKLIVTAAADVAAAPAAKYSGFEILQNNAAANLDVSLFTADAFTSLAANNASAGFINMSAAQAAAITLLVSNTGGTFALANSSGASDVIALTLQNALPANVATPISLTGAQVNGFETMDVNVASGINTAVSTALATGADQITFTAATSLKSLVVTGAYDVGIDASANAAALTAIDFSGLAGATTGAGIKLGGQTGALVVTGSGAADYITLGTPGGAGTETINAGGGNDNIVGTLAQVSGASTTIDGGAGTDTLTITDGAAVTIIDTNFAQIQHVENLVVTSSVAGAQSITLATDFEAAGFNSLTTSSTSGTITIDAHATAAADTFAASSTLAGGNISITGGTGGDTITETVASTATANIVGGTGVDTITVSSGSGAVSITGGAGADTINLGAHTGIDTIVYTGSNQGGAALTITAGGSLAAGDVVAGTAGFKTATDIINVNAVATTHAAAAGTLLNSWNTGTDGVLVDTATTLGGAAPTIANVSALIGTVTSSAGDKGFVAIQTNAATNIWDVFQVVSVNAHAGAALATTDTISLVGTFHTDAALTAGMFTP